tara:strand:- start:13066 stop:13413 length:348 start_codon:yes stop_codon:yes gene_type:complete
MTVPNYFLFDITTAREIAKPFIIDLQKHLSGRPEVDIDKVLNQWFAERLVTMGVLHHDNPIETDMPLGVILFLNNLPDVIKGSVDQQLFRAVSNHWHPDTSVKTYIKDQTLVINA